MAANLQKYLDKSVAVLEKFGILSQKDEESQLATLLNEVVSVDEPKVLAIAKTVGYMGTFNQLVRDKVESVNVADRYNDITQMFDSIREDSKVLLEQIADGKIDLKEKFRNFYMKLRRGTTHQRFEKIKAKYQAVSEDTGEQLGREDEIMDAYMDFRFALKESEILAYEVLKTQEQNKAKSDDVFKKAVETVSNYSGEAAEKSRLELTRDEAQRIAETEDKKYQLIKDVAENLTVGYNVGETLVAKLKQTHDVKDQVYRRAITFFTTNEHVFTIMDAVYTSQYGLHESTQTLEAMKAGANKGLEDIANLGRELEKAGLKAGYGATLSPASVQKLVDSVVSYQLESKQMIAQLREESTKNAREIARIVEDGKQRCQNAIANYTPAA